MEEQAKRNAPHIAKVKMLQDQILAASSLVTKDAKWDKVEAAINAVAKEVRGSFNNREMSLVNTKLQEASHWAVEKDATQVKIKLTEAKNWATAFIVELS